MKCLCISDFNIEVLQRTLKNHIPEPRVDAICAPYGQVLELILNSDADCWKWGCEMAIVWTRPQAIIPSFTRLLNFEKVSIDSILDEVDQYASHLVSILGKVKAVVIPTWIMSYRERGLGVIDMTHSQGIGHALMHMNLRLVERLQEHKSIYVIDTHKWLAEGGKDSYTNCFWYMTKAPFSLGVYLEAVYDIKALVSAIRGESKKLLVMDLDDTIWGGIVGDVGWRDLRLGGHDPIGEAFVDFQMAIKNLSKRGVILGIVSKNEEGVALEAIRNHPEMILKETDFVGWRINWNEKATNIKELAKELNLGLQSVVFLDDSPIEREWVRTSLPEVFVPEMPKDKMLYKQTLTELHCFDTIAISEEDEQRSKMYTVDRQRKELSKEVVSADDFLKSMDVKIKVDPLLQENLLRTAQLLNKTNQMNLSTRRMTEQELWGWAQKPENKIWTIRVNDKFGDSGLVGVVSMRTDGEIVDFILSCRVFGRKIEETMVWLLVDYARTVGIKTIQAKYVKTDKNKPTLSFFERSGLKPENETCFNWDTAIQYPLSELITIEYENNLSAKL